MNQQGEKRIGVLTGGGDCPGLNAVIRAVVKTALNKYQWDVVGIIDGYDGLILPNLAKRMTLEDVRGILPRGGTILGTTNRSNPFEYKTEENGKVVVKDISDQAIKRIKELSIDALLVIGGDGSLKIANRFLEKGIPVVGIPKTIDNDLQATDQTFGFRTAVETATEAIDKLHTTAESHHRVMVLEVMGRYAGWIALESGIAGGADVILIPEIPYDLNKILRTIQDRCEHRRFFSIIVVAEGAKSAGGDMTVSKAASLGEFERLGGVGHKVAAEIEKELDDVETRVTVLGHLQRGGSPCPFDRILGSRYGMAGVDLVAEGKFGYMPCLRGLEIQSVTIEEAVGSFKLVNPDGQMVKTAETLGIDFGR
jgi:ATP-dependent phosphofructokinase / diphosphate-dependent phosphofructokinase